MNSMTGYGRASAAAGHFNLTVQVSSVNRKTLDLTVALPREWESLEPEVIDAVRKSVGRGKVHVDVELTGAGPAGGPDWSEEAVRRALDRLRNLAKKRKVPFEVTTELLWRIASTEGKSARVPAAKSAWPVLRRTLGEALRGFAGMRAKEGAALQADLLARTAWLGRHLEAIASRAPQVPALQREALLKRLREAGLELDPDDGRVLKELALFADRCDVSEELTRLRSHLDQFAQLLRAEGEIGRKAEFLLQEIGRESHTVGSKANDLAIAKTVIEFKNELERVREQIANVE
ncbi:MAG: YicC family protein [Verrucomicrobia bacterium RIFCSPLOWO2_12_FULL_64_8]|nr:MAG: YicC family protein [Verrucomicrobia bacterium RIFCSPLOWO2_12_FULL_64_8]